MSKLSREKDRAAQEGYLWLSCPCCSRAGLIRWDQLHRLLHCRACAAWFHSENGGHLQEVPPPNGLRVGVRSCLSRYEEHWAPLPGDSLLRRSWRGLCDQLDPEVLTALVGPWKLGAALGLVAVVALLGLSLWMRPPQEKPLPNELEPRLQLFAQAWRTQDMGRMGRLTAPEGFLARWVQHTPVPAWLQGDPTAEQVPVTVTISTLGNETAEVEIQFAPGDSATAAGDLVLKLRWVERDGTWVFLPPSRPGDQRLQRDND
jgi:hypothetical protein